MTDEPWQRYLLAPTLDMRPYVPGEDLSNINTANVPHPQSGDRVARDPNSGRMWIISAQAFSGYSPAAPATREAPAKPEERKPVRLPVRKGK